MLKRLARLSLRLGALLLSQMLNPLAVVAIVQAEDCEKLVDRLSVQCMLQEGHLAGQSCRERALRQAGGCSNRVMDTSPPPAAVEKVPRARKPVANAAPPSAPPAAAGNPAAAGSCSTISGIAGAAPKAADCLQVTRWRPREPYSHSKVPVDLRLGDGRTVTIQPGHSLYSLPDASEPSGRRLVSQPWDGVARLVGAGCRKEAPARGGPFMVSLVCEIDRQRALAQEQVAQADRFGHREDTYPYIDEFECRRLKGTIEETPGWRARPASYWRANPGEPVGWCNIPARDGRVDRRKLREPGWLTVQRCETLHPRVAITANSRGVLGCSGGG